jgi:hypothetical protein
VTVHYGSPYDYYGSSYDYYGPSYYRTSYPAPVYRAPGPTRGYYTPRPAKVRPFRGWRR